MTNSQSALETALALLDRGFWPIALHPVGATIATKDGDKIAKGKEPIGTAWGKKPPTESSLRASFDRNPQAGVGILLGPGGGAIDLEIDGPDGEDSLVRLLGGEVVPTLGWSSRRGPHRLFRWDDRLASLGKTKIDHPDLPGLEIRLGGAQAQLQSACPPSFGEDGIPRRWNELEEVASLPEAAIAFLIETLIEGPQVEVEGRMTIPLAIDPAAAWFQTALRNESGRVATAVEGTRHNTLLRAAKTIAGMLHHGYLDESDVVSKLTIAGLRSGLPGQEVGETIRDGLAYGKAAPLPWPDRLDEHEQNVSDEELPMAGLSSTDPWPALAIHESPPSPPFPVEVFPPSLAQYCREVAKATLAPISFVGAVMLAVASAAIGHTVKLRLKKGWSEPAQLWIILVAKPGKSKSPVIRTVRKPLQDIDARLRKASSDALEEWRKEMLAYDRTPEGEPPGPEPPQLRAIVKDITRESLVIVLKENPRGLLDDPDEASGWVASFNEYKSKGGSDRQFWLSLWQCDPVSVDRKGGRESIHVPYPFVSVIAGIQPTMLTSLVDEKGRDDGFLDRILFVYPDPASFPPQRWNEEDVSDRSERAWIETITRLHETPMLEDAETELLVPTITRISDQGKERMVDWFNAHSIEAESPDFPDQYAGAWSKMRAHFARIALILSRIRTVCEPGYLSPGPNGTNIGTVEPCDLEGAGMLASFFQAQLVRIDHEVTSGVGNRHSRAILGWIKRHGKRSFREAEVAEDLRHFRHHPRDLREGIKSLLDAQVIRRENETVPAGKRGPKPSTRYQVHPDLFPSTPEDSANPPIPISDSPESQYDGISGIIGQIPDASKAKPARLSG